MKTLIVFAALATAIASPALARPAYHPAHQTDGVTSGSQYLGADPDAQVRFDLQRESGTRNGSF